MRRIFRALFWILSPVTAWLVFSVAGAIVPGPNADIGGDKTVRIGLVAGLIHYDFLLPNRPDTIATFGFAAGAQVPVNDPNLQWVVIGWGAREFYTTTGSYANVSAHAVWRGVIGDSSVLRVDVAGALSDDIPVSWLLLSEAQFTALLTSIRAGFGPVPHALDELGFTDSDAFYASAGPFSALRTCNVWVGEVLRAAGVRFGAWTPAPWSVKLSLWWFGD